MTTPNGRQRRVGFCDECKHYVAGWHRCVTPIPVDDDSPRSVRFIEDPDLGAPYFARLGDALAATKRRRQKTRAVSIDEWREPPGYPGYVLHSQSRQLRRQPRDVTLPSGKIRHYPERVQKPKNGSYSLTVDGVTSSRGVNALWVETFPEFTRKPKKKIDGEWDDTVFLRTGKTYLEGTEGVPEWLDTGIASVATRPT